MTTTEFADKAADLEASPQTCETVKDKQEDRPVYKRLWFIALMVILGLALLLLMGYKFLGRASAKLAKAKPDELPQLQVNLLSQEEPSTNTSKEKTAEAQPTSPSDVSLEDEDVPQTSTKSVELFLEPVADEEEEGALKEEEETLEEEDLDGEENDCELPPIKQLRLSVPREWTISGLLKHLKTQEFGFEQESIYIQLRLDDSSSNLDDDANIGDLFDKHKGEDGLLHIHYDISDTF